MILVVAALLAAPVLSAVAAPVDPHWKRGTGEGHGSRAEEDATPRFLVDDRRVLRDPPRVPDGRGWGWRSSLPMSPRIPRTRPTPPPPPGSIDYPNYASQACVIYLVLCFAVAWYGTRLRTLAGGKDQGGLTHAPLMTIIRS